MWATQDRVRRTAGIANAYTCRESVTGSIDLSVWVENEAISETGCREPKECHSTVPASTITEADNMGARRRIVYEWTYI